MFSPKHMQAHIVGFTGTRVGMNSVQEAAFKSYLNIAIIHAFHHGDCVGADAQAHEMVARAQPKARIYVHPPTESTMRAKCRGAYMVCEPLPYVQRNHAIVDACELVFATPKEQEEILRSGTWATIRYTRQMRKPLIIILPDGTRIHS